MRILKLMHVSSRDNEAVLHVVQNNKESADTASSKVDSAFYLNPVDMKTISLLGDRL